MNLKISGLHFDITSALREYIEARFERLEKRLDSVLTTTVTLSVDKLDQKAEIDMHLSGRNIHVEAVSPRMYSTIDEVMEKLDRQIVKYKEKQSEHRVHVRPAEDVL